MFWFTSRCDAAVRGNDDAGVSGLVLFPKIALKEFRAFRLDLDLLLGWVTFVTLELDVEGFMLVSLEGVPLGFEDDSVAVVIVIGLNDAEVDETEEVTRDLMFGTLILASIISFDVVGS